MAAARWEGAGSDSHLALSTMPRFLGGADSCPARQSGVPDPREYSRGTCLECSECLAYTWGSPELSHLSLKRALWGGDPVCGEGGSWDPAGPKL